VIVLGVTIAGALGAVARYIVDVAVRERVQRPSVLGTFLVNITGAFVMGVVTGLALGGGLGGRLAGGSSTIIGIGFLGAYTTFSTFVFEVVETADQRSTRRAVWYVLVSIAIGLAAAGGGLRLGEGI
jgi:fluoride exporter